jgi:hypothetical protein
VLWLTITDFRIEDTNFDEETEKLIMKVSTQTANAKAIDELSDINWKAMDNYAKTKNLDIMQDAANNEWALWGMVWTMVWMNMWNMMSSWVNTNWNSSNHEEKLEKLKSMLDKNLITQEEYDTKKKEILETL